MKRITVILLFMLPLLIVGQDLNNPSTLGQRNRNQKFPKGLQVEDTTLLKGAVWLPGFTHGGDSVLTVTGGFLQLVPAGGGATGPTGAAESIIYDTLTARITANSLTPGAKYILTDFASYHRVPNQFDEFGYLDTIYAPAGEPLVLTATSDSTVAKEVYSLTWPGDVVRYEPFPTRQADRGMLKGMITYRRSPEGIETSYDWRTARVRRFDNGSGKIDHTPLNYALPFSDVLTIQNTDNVVNVYIAPLADTVVEEIYARFAAFGADFDLWNNNTVLMFAPGKAWQQGNVYFNGSVINSHIDVATHAAALSSFGNTTFENGTEDFVYWHDTTTRKNDSWYPYFNNAVFSEGAQRVRLQNTFLEDASFYGNFQDVHANNWGIAFFNGSLTDCTLDSAYIQNSTGVFNNSVFENAEIGGSHFTNADRLFVYEAMVNFATFNGGVNNTIIDGRDTLTGAVTNSTFLSEVYGAHIGITVNKSLFKMAFYADWFNQCGGNGVSNLNAAHIVDNQPPCALTAVYSPTHVQTYERANGTIQYIWSDGSQFKGYPYLGFNDDADTIRSLDMDGFDFRIFDGGDFSFAGNNSLFNVNAFKVAAGGVNKASVRTTSLTADRVYRMPDVSGEISAQTTHLLIVDPVNSYTLTTDTLAKYTLFVLLEWDSGDTLYIEAPPVDFSLRFIKNDAANNIIVNAAPLVTIAGTDRPFTLPPDGTVLLRRYGGDTWIRLDN